MKKKGWARIMKYFTGNLGIVFKSMGLDEITWGVDLNTEMSESDFSGKEALIKTDKQTNKQET